METEFSEIGMRIAGLRDACDVTQEDMAAELGVSLETYRNWEKTGADVPISAIYHMANIFGVEFTEILTGTAAKLNTYHVVKAGEGKEVDTIPAITTRTWRGAILERSYSLYWSFWTSDEPPNWSPIMGRSSTLSSKAPSS
ncbi:MAG: helix-turn-helix domain-containing protein [Slackia sp.]